MKDKSFGVIPFLLKKGKLFFLVVHHNKGHWGFPKGHKKLEDTDKYDTALRELDEEVGIRKLRLFTNISFTEKYSFKEDGQDIDKIVEYFLAEVLENEVVMDKTELQDFAWLEEHDAYKRLTHAESKRICKEAQNWLHHYQ